MIAALGQGVFLVLQLFGGCALHSVRARCMRPAVAENHSAKCGSARSCDQVGLEPHVHLNTANDFVHRRRLLLTTAAMFCNSWV